MNIVEHNEGLVPGPGFYRMPAALYHQDPAPEPSLSSTIAKAIVAPDSAPIKAMLAHPRVGPGVEESDPSRVAEIGTAAHKLVLGHGSEVLAIDAADYRKDAVKQQRKDAYEAGLAPILRDDLKKATAIAQAVTAHMARTKGCDGFSGAAAEVVAICQDETGAWLRAMFDKVEIRDDRAIVWDLKSGDQPAAPAGLGRRIANMGFEVSAAHYERVLVRLMPQLAGRITFRWVFVENEAPYLVQVAELDAMGLAVGRKKVAAAIALWNRGVSTGDWPGYPPGIVTVEYPNFAEAAWMARELDDPLLADLPLDPVLAAPTIRARQQLSEIAG